MSRRKKNINDLSRFLKYTRNGISGKERNTFERRLQKDPFDAEAAEGISMVTPEEAKKDLRDIRKRLKVSGKKRRLFTPLRIAAVLILLLGTTILTTLIKSDQKKQPLNESISPEKHLAVVESKGVKKEPRIKSDKVISGVNASKEKQVAPVAMDQKEEAIVEAPPVTAEVLKTDADQRKLSNFALMEEMEAKEKAKAPEKGLRTIEGTVVSTEDNLPIPGVSIAIKGTNIGVITDVDGKFSLETGTDSSLMLVARFVGMEPQEVTAKPDSDLLIAMNNDNVSLDEVVVVGYGVEKKESVTGSVSTVKISEQTNSYDHTDPIPVTGYESFRSYVRSNLRYPAAETGRKKEIVVIGMTVLRNGTITDIKIIKSPSQPFSEEAIRLIKEGPAWKAATLDGIAQDEEVRVRIVFEGPRK